VICAKKNMTQKSKKNSLPRAKHGPRQRRSLPRATGKALGKEFCKKKIKNLCRGSDGWPSAKADGARLPLLSTLKLPRASLPRTFLCRGLFFAEGLSWRPSAKKVFAECPRFGPRQSLKPSTKNEFPVVYLLSLRSS